MSPVGLMALALAVQVGAPPSQARVGGVVRDADTGVPLAGVRVSLTDLDREVVTDRSGRYAVVSVPAGPQHVVLSRLGYRDRTLHLLVPGTGRLVVDAALQPDPIRLPGLAVRPVRPVGGLDVVDGTSFPDRSVTHDALRQHPTLTQSDALRALAGGETLAAPEAPSGLHIRGGAADHTGYLLDGIPVFSPYHAAGLFGAWNPDALGDLQLLGSAPSPALPDALSGSVSARSLEPGDRLRVQATVSNAEARTTVDGPGPGSVGFLLSWRQGLGAALAPRDESSYLAGETGDLMAKVEAPLFGGAVRLLWYETEDELGAAATASVDGPPSDTPSPRNAFEWASRSLGATWDRRLSASTGLRVDVWQARADAGSLWHGGAVASQLASRRRDVGGRVLVTREGPGASTELGLRMRRVGTAYAVRPPGDRSTLGVDLEGTRNVWTAFAAHSRVLVPGLDGWAGASVSLAGGEFRVAPRARLRWQATGTLTLSAAYSRTVQYAQSLRNPASPAGAVFPSDLFLGAGVGGVPVPTSDQVVLATGLQPAPGLRIGAQLFLRRLSDVVVVAPTTPGPFATAPAPSGETRARGASVELAARGARYGVVASYGLQRVRVRTAELTWTPHHGTAHTFDAGVIVFPGATSSVRLSVAGATGRTGTALAGPLEWETCNAVDRGCEFAGSPELAGPPGGLRLPGYVRVDLGARKHWHLRVGGRDVLLGLWGTFTNLLGRANVLTYAPDPESGRLSPVEMLPRTPLVLGLDLRY